MHGVTNISFRTANYFADFLVFTLAYVLGFVTWLYIHGGRLDPAVSGTINWDTLLTIYLIYYGSNFFFLAYFKVYHSSRLREVSEIMNMYLKAVAMAFLLAILVGYFFPFLRASRTQFVSATAYAFALLLLKELLLRYFLTVLRKAGNFQRRTLIVGSTPKKIEELYLEFKEDHLLGMAITGSISPSEIVSDVPLKSTKIPCLGTVSDLPRIIDEKSIDTVIFFAQELTHKDLQEATWRCEERGLEVWVQLAFLDRIIYRASIDALNGIPFINFRGTPQNEAALSIKFLIDKIVAFTLLLFLWPLFLILPYLIKKESPGPAIFTQQRSGLNGRPFTFYKFRTMTDNADQLKDELRQFNEMSGPAFKMSNDPRITKLGSFLRKTSLDELPQLWNVLKGDMSLVGPRPLPIEEVKEFHGWHRRRLSMRPGITGAWQVSGRSNLTDFDLWARMDLDYIDRWSLGRDVGILLKTIPAVLFRAGAR